MFSFFQLTKELRRPTRKLEDLENFKANELKVWLLYIGPVTFEGIIDEDLYTRFLMFSYCVRLLMISAEYCDESQRLLKSYLDRTETAYTKTAFSANLHAVSHLSEQVRNFGPFWVFSAMMFEVYWHC